MSTEFRKTALMNFLHSADPVLWTKIVELRSVIEDWLSYIPQTFPHYTRHTVRHSDAIIVQLSKLLFLDEDPEQPVIKLSAMEAYILAAAAYLHDAGMVTSDRQKKEILESSEWKAWTSDGSGARRLKEIDTFRTGSSPTDPQIRNFLADVQTRFLIAEFVRRTHHLRARDFMIQNVEQLGRFSLGDPVLLRTIAAVCVSHGLRQDELEDPDQYPERSDILDQPVNVRFLAILLRLGDLLDLSNDRACPLLLNAASPLPAESLAHWTQYSRINQRLTSTDRIEVIARCENQTEHSYLKDWCQWLVQEVRNAAVAMARAPRHGNWQAPKATIDCPDATIRIEPLPDATYIPSDWHFELDQELVFRRLIDDLYTEPHTFVRELIQNALDASRCQMYLDLQNESIDSPELPTQVPESIRHRYAVSLKLEMVELKNELSGEVEERQRLTVEDSGIGMDRNIIQNYLLQVGRSYYTTHDFQRNFKFVPTSRFGVGFLSVFRASDHVVFETYKPSSRTCDGPLRVILKGPRNYVLLEKSERRRSGTRIEIVLRESFEKSQLTGLVRSWCRRVEFPIHVSEFGTEITITAERKEQFVYEIPDVLRKGAKYAVRAFDIQRHGIEGELYVFARVDSRGESWDAWSLANYQDPRDDPRVSKPDFPESLYCIHGIGFESGSRTGPCSARLDFRRGKIPTPSLSREKLRLTFRGLVGTLDDRITTRWAEIIDGHLASCERAKSPDGWRYKQALVDFFPTTQYWQTLPGTIPVHFRHETHLISLHEALKLPELATIMGSQVLELGTMPIDRKSMPQVNWQEDIPAIFADELTAFSGAHRTALFQKRSPASTCWLSTEHFVMYWNDDSGGGIFGGPSYNPSRLVAMTSAFWVGFRIPSLTDSGLESTIFNSANTLIQWALRIKMASEDQTSSVTKDHFEYLRELLQECCGYLYKVKELEEYLAKWRKMKGLPSELLPPDLRLVPEAFVRFPEPQDPKNERPTNLKRPD
jgi:molecular chaperone HtpG